MELSSAIEAVLFYKSEPISCKELARILSCSPSDTEEGLRKLEEHLNGRGVLLMRKDGEVMLGTVPDASNLIDQMTREELSNDLGKAALETLAIILYHGPVTRAEINHIRGVNATFILRSLLIRGLIERVTSVSDARSYQYRPTFDLLSHLGIKDLSLLPEYEQVRKSIMEFRSGTESKSEMSENTVS